MRLFFKTIRFLIPLAVTLLVLSFLFSKIDYKEIGKTFAQSNKMILLGGIFIFFLPILISVLRWRALMKLINYDIPLKTIFSAYLASLPISRISPLNSGDLMRTFYLKNEIPVAKNMGIVFLENMFNLTFISLLALLGGLMLKIKIAILIGATIVLANLLFFIFVPKINLKIKEEWKIRLANFSDVFRTLLKNPKSLLLVVLYTFLIWLMILTYFKIIFYSLGINMSFFYIIAAQPIAILFGLIPITFSGVGARESLMVYLYYNLAPLPHIIAAGLIYSFSVVVLLPLAGLPFLIVKAWKIKSFS